MSNMPRTAPSFCGVGPRARRTQAGVGSSSGTGGSSGGCGIFAVFSLLLGVAAMAFADLSFRTSCSALLDFAVFRGVVCGFAGRLRRLSYSLYFAASDTSAYRLLHHSPSDRNAPIAAAFLISSRSGLRPFVFAKSDSQSLSSLRSSSGPVGCMAWLFDMVRKAYNVQMELVMLMVVVEDAIY